MKVKFFAHLQIVAGCEELAISSQRELTTDELWQILEKKIPGIIRYKASTRLAQNFTYAADANATFHPEDEIALIPPVSGG